LLAAGLLAPADPLPAQSGAPEPDPELRAPLTLPEAMALGRTRARAVAAAEARRAASRERVAEARSHRLPTVRLQEIWLRTDSPAEAFALRLNQERFSFQDFVAGDPNHPEAVESALTRLEVELPLYTGGELSSRIRQAELAAESMDYVARGTADGAALAAAEAYLQLAQAAERVALLERSAETVAAHVETARAYVDQGMLVRSELLRAEVERARVEDLLEDARGGVGLARASLAFRLVTEPELLGALPPLPAPPPPPEALEAWLARADERPDLAAARRMASVAELEVDVRRAARKPRVGLLVRGDLVDDVPFGGHGDSTAVIAQGSLDLWAGGRHRAGAAAARAEAEAARHEVDELADAVRLEVRQAWVVARSARRRHVTAAAALDAAAETERITGERFRSGVVSTLDLLDAATARREAETRELVARAEASLASLRLAVAAGQPPESALSPSPAPSSDDSEDPDDPELPRSFR
jgi:outer membrane protein TolC